MKFFRSEIMDGKIHILDYPNANKVLSLPDDCLTKQLKDMLLHWDDLMEAKNCLEAMNSNYPDIVNKALAQNAIVVFYKCFGTNKSRNNSLKKDKILANYPPEAKAVFDYYKNLRDKFIVHDESRLAQVFTGAILQTDKTPPFVDIVSTVAIAEKFKSKEEIEGLSSFHRLTLVSLQWVESKIDELSDLIKKEYRVKALTEFEGFEALSLSVPNNEDIFKKRY